jgi:serine/threonine protein kinase
MLGVKHRIGGYRVIAPIGAGGFATVYRALDEETGKEVAIKVLAENHSLVPDTRRRFEEEMGLLMTVKSPTIAKIYKVGETEAGQPFMVLELADRGDLRRRLEEIRGNHQVLNREDLTMLANHLYDSLRHLHGMEIIHRDVSPGNILIRSRQGGGERAPGITLLEPGERFLLTDLGHAKDMILASGFTAGGGTRGFASPEQRDDVTVVDHRADIFAATAILEWAAHDGLYAEALDPFFDIGLAAEPEDRFDSMEEWHNSFSATMAATMLDGSQPSKVGRVIRRLKSGRPAIDDFDLDDINPEMLLGETALSRPPGGITPPGMSSQPKVVRPPGSPGDHSIGRATNSHAKPVAVSAEGSAQLRGPDADGQEPIDHRLDDRTHEDAPAVGQQAVAAAVSSSPLTRVDPETLVDRLTSPDYDEAPNRTRSRRLALAIGFLVMAGVLAFGLAQELGNRTISVGTDSSDLVATPSADDAPPTADADGAETTDESGAPTAEADGEEPQLFSDVDGQEQPADLLVAVDPEGQALDENGEPVTDEARFESSTGGADLTGEPDRPTVLISSPEQNAELTLDELTITGTATASEDTEQVQVAIRNLDTLLYWNSDESEFGAEWATVTINLADRAGEHSDEHRILAWSISVPADALTPGTYQIRTWLRTGGTSVAPRNDSRTITILG